MSRQDKATTDKFARTLRELVKRPENKVCADCKRNDPRWASWNLGVFLCIRCSGIHRGMGTHISKVKSVDLDVWTPEQMESIQKWGNHLANLYWEAHLKQGHVPPEHKMESFIRSKYESRRWALDGPPPSDPSGLDSGSGVPQPASSSQPPPTTTIRSTHTHSQSISNRVAVAAPVTARQPQAHQLLSSNYTSQPAAAPTSIAVAPSPQPSAPKAPDNDLFSLDFHAPAASSAPITSEPKKDVKQDILSLFSANPTSSAGQFNGQGSLWGGGQPAVQQQQPVPMTGMMGSNGTGMWGTSSGWTGASPAPAQPNVWGTSAGMPLQQQQQTAIFNTNAIWGGSPAAVGNSNPADHFGSVPAATAAHPAQKNDDVFGDIWGGFK